MLAQALSIAVILIGIYILTLHFFMREPALPRSDAVFHLGCYDPQYSNTHSEDLTRKIMELEQMSTADMKLNMYHSKALSSGFDSQVQDLALAFEEYVNNYYKFKVRSDRDLQFYNSLHLAKREFEMCQKNQPLDSQACLNDWKAYQNSFQSFQGLKKELIRLIKDKQDQQRRIAAVILQHTDEDEEDIQKKYSVKIGQLKAKLSKQQQKLIALRTRKSKLWQEINLSEDNLEELKNKLHEFTTNQKLITFCQSISQNIQSIPRRSKTSLEERINKKLQIVHGLENNLRKIRKSGTNGEVQIKESQLEIQRRQLMLLQAEVSNFQTTEESKCSEFSSQSIAQLRAKIDLLTTETVEMKKIFSSISQDLALAEDASNEYKAEIESTNLALEAQINSKFCIDDRCKEEQKQNLIGLERALNELKKQIIDKQIEINFLKTSQKKKLESMDKYLPGIQDVTTCLFKKDFYVQLKSKAPQKTDINEKMVGFRQKVIKQLNDLEL